MMLISALGKTLCRLLPCVGPEVLREWARYLEHAGLAILGAVPIIRDRAKVNGSSQFSRRSFKGMRSACVTSSIHRLLTPRLWRPW